MLNGNHYDGTDVNFISCKVGRDSNESLNANWLENLPFFVVSLLFPFATYIFSLSFFIYSPFFHEYKSSPISERNLLIFNQIIIMYICLIRGKKYKVKPKNIMFCNIRYLGQHLLLPWGKSNFFFNQNFLQLPMYLILSYWSSTSKNTLEKLSSILCCYKFQNVSFIPCYIRHVSKEKWFETRKVLS